MNKPASAAKKPTTDIDQLLDLLFAHKASFVRALLRTADLTTSGKRSVIRDRLGDAIESGKIPAQDVLRYLDKIEGWGRQHVFLYGAPAGALLKVWRSEEQVKGILRAAKSIGLLNKQRSVMLPEKPTLSCVQWTPSRLRLVWTEKRTWEERVEENDKVSEDGHELWKAYFVRRERGTLAFDWDLGSGTAMVMIQQLPSGSRYAEARDGLGRLMSKIIDLDEFPLVRVGQAIIPIVESDEVRVRGSSLDTPAGGGVSFRSASKGRDVGDDPVLAQAEDAVLGVARGSHGNFYWLKDFGGSLDRDFHVTIHAKDQRIGLLGERREEEVRYVIERIRTYC